MQLSGEGYLITADDEVRRPAITYWSPQAEAGLRGSPGWVSSAPGSVTMNGMSCAKEQLAAAVGGEVEGQE